MVFPALLFTLMSITTVSHAGQEADEYTLKAAFLYNFAKFVDWPAESFANEDSSLDICILGSDPFGSKLDNIKNKNVKGKRITIRRLESVSETNGCKILFLSGSEEKRLQQILVAVRKSNMLTIGDTEGFAESGVMINFYTDKNRIRLEINLNTAKRAGLKISSDLLKLARII